MNELQLLNQEEVKINSVELVDIINQYRMVESEKIGKDYKELQHKNFMAKIQKEVEVLESLGLEGELNFKPSSYVNSQNKTQPCFSLNRDGMLQMLNSESVYVRYKTIEYIKELESRLTQINQLSAPNNFDKLIEKIDTKTNQLSDYYKPTHKRKLEINKYIKQCLGVNTTKENCDKVKEILLTQLGYEIYDEVPIDILHSKETYKKVFDICYMISCNNNQVQMNIEI